jgi:hypothetical protein
VVSRTLDERTPFSSGYSARRLYLAPGKTFAGANQQARIAGMFALSPRL